MARQLGHISIWKISPIYGEVALEMEPFTPIIGIQSCWDWHGENALSHKFFAVRSRQTGSPLLACLT